MLKLKVEGQEWEVESFKFPAGETGVQIVFPEGFVGRLYEEAEIELLWEGNDDLFSLAQLVDTVKYYLKPDVLVLSLRYFPYARQDRRCHIGEGHSLKMAASFINSLGFDHVLTEDAHSYVLEALVENLVITPQCLCATDLPLYTHLIAPDAGASKKVYTHKQVVEGLAEVIVASKTRNQDGSISIVVPQIAHAENIRACVVDDICDGGYTFIELAKALPEGMKLDLYVTHGIFSKGVDELRKYYDNIYVHNLMNKAVQSFVMKI